MAKEGIVFELRRILDKAIKDSAVSVKENIQVLINGKHRNIAIEVIPLPNLIEPHYLVLFHEINRIGNNLSANSNKKISSLKIKRDQKDLRIHQLEEELMQTREDMRIIAKAQEAATEELQSANEELVSGSEELQSLNEELETSKEELLSTNEELMVVSQEMVSLNEQVSEARDYTEAIIDTIREPLLVLDNNLRVKSANKTFYKTFRVNEHETEGVLVYDLGNKQWNIPSLKKLLEEILPQNTKFTDFEVTHEFPIIGERIMLLNACEMVTENKSGKLILLALEDITERKIAERKVEESELFYRSVLESSPDCIKILDAGGRLQFMNTNGICLMEIDDFNLVKNKYWWDLWEKGNQQLVKDAVTKALNGEKVKFQAFRPTSKDSPKWWDIIVSPIYDTDKANPPRILSVSRDITEQKQHEVKKQELLGRFQNLVKHAPVAICVLRGENYVIEVINERMLEMWDTKAEDALNKTAFEVLPELIDLGFKDLLDTVFYKGERIVAEEIPIDLKRRGKIEHAFVNFVYEPLRDEDGTISGVMALAHEITEQVRAKNQNMEMHQVRAKELEEKVQQRTLELSSANEELQQKNQEVALSKYNKRFLTEFSDKFSAHEVHNEFFNSLVQFIADTTHLDYIFVGKLEQNEQDEFIIQTIAVNAFGKLSENFNYPLPDGPCEQVIGGTIYSYPRQCRKIFPKNKTIEQFNVEGYIGFPLHDEKGDPVGLIAVMHQQEISDDETVSAVMKIVARRAELELERIKFEEQLLQNNKSLAEKNDELEKINKELQAFTYVSSHDLQEPLRKIKTFASLLHDQEDQNLSNRGKDYLNRVQQAANRMQSLIEDLLDYSHINITERKFENTDITKIIEDVKNELAENILEKNAIIEVVNVCQVKIIPFQFRQLMHNLIGNALKFSRSGISPHIVIKGETVKGGKIPHEKLVAEKDYCHISISDNGIGFDPQYKNRIFEIFQRLYSKNEYEGTGIGLAIVKKIVENHNGVITATSELGKGATFDIYIPHNEKNSN